MIISEERHQYLLTLIRDKNGRKATDLTPEEEEYVEDAKKGIWRSITLACFLSDANTEYVLLVSRQCPAGYINDPKSETGENCKCEMPEEAIVGQDLSMQWNQIKILATSDIAAGQELFFAYGGYEPSGPIADSTLLEASESPAKASQLLRHINEMVGSPEEATPYYLMSGDQLREAQRRDREQRVAFLQKLSISTFGSKPAVLAPPAGTAVFLCMANVHKGYKTPKSQNNPSGGGGPERDRDRLEMIRRTDAR
ncbi:MAG: hypothetical protein P4L67_02515, partial [Candidatus Pacebacteria bacterium]|nr:hypothetical protein [Candidatus Paceibacterota bacterium]